MLHFQSHPMHHISLEEREEEGDETYECEHLVNPQARIVRTVRPTRRNPSTCIRVLYQTVSHQVLILVYKILNLDSPRTYAAATSLTSLSGTASREPNRAIR